MLGISTFKASYVQKHTWKCGLFEDASHRRKAIHTRMHKTHLPRRFFPAGAPGSHQYRPVALRTLQLQHSFRTNFKQKVATQKPHLPSKDSSGSGSRQLMKEEGYVCIILGETQPPPINKCIDTQMGCISLASNIELGINVVIVCTDTSLTLTKISSVFKQQRPGRRSLYHTLSTPSILILQELEDHAVKTANLLF